MIGWQGDNPRPLFYEVHPHLVLVDNGMWWHFWLPPFHEGVVQQLEPRNWNLKHFQSQLLSVKTLVCPGQPSVIIICSKQSSDPVKIFIHSHLLSLLTLKLNLWPFLFSPPQPIVRLMPLQGWRLSDTIHSVQFCHPLEVGLFRYLWILMLSYMQYGKLTFSTYHEWPQQCPQFPSLSSHYQHYLSEMSPGSRLHQPRVNFPNGVI